MTAFIDAMTNWNQRKDAFVKDNLEPGSSKAPRKAIFITVPLEFEEDIKNYVKAKRKLADSTFKGSPATRKTELMIQFEENNPPPKRSDFE